jgi:hypothetical protein
MRQKLIGAWRIQPPADKSTDAATFDLSSYFSSHMQWVTFEKSGGLVKSAGQAKQEAGVLNAFLSRLTGSDEAAKMLDEKPGSDWRAISLSDAVLAVVFLDEGVQTFGALVQFPEEGPNDSGSFSFHPMESVVWRPPRNWWWFPLGMQPIDRTCSMFWTRKRRSN